jgi:beta-1,2-mannobiose phosphorylase / 1,2-beta-oligomannan phosphorylase
MSGPELFHRHPANPILTAEQWPYRVNAVFNPAAAKVDGDTVLLARVEDRRGISHLTVARSANGMNEWAIEPEPLLAPDDEVASEHWGFEDARVVWVDELSRFVITCTAYGPAGPAVYLATTQDFVTVERHGVIRQPEDKNAALLPHRVDGKWLLLHRPKTEFGGARGEILLSRSDDLASWSTPEQVMQPRAGAWWDSLRIGIGPPPIRTEHGWLLVYHGVKGTVSGDIYRAGLALLDLEEPTKVLGRCSSWVLAPLAPYERTGDVPNVVFPCGLIHDATSGQIRLYYGAADCSICLATAHLDDLVDAVLTSPPDGAAPR